MNDTNFSLGHPVVPGSVWLNRVPLCCFPPYCSLVLTVLFILQLVSYSIFDLLNLRLGLVLVRSRSKRRALDTGTIEVANYNGSQLTCIRIVFCALNCTRYFLAQYWIKLLSLYIIMPFCRLQTFRKCYCVVVIYWLKRRYTEVWKLHLIEAAIRHHGKRAAQ